MNRDLMALNNFFGDVFDVADQINNGFVDQKKLHVDWDTNDDGYIVKAELPGINEEDIDVNVENGVLTIKAEYKEEDKHSLRTGKYKWAARVQDVDTDAITAELKKGVLVINLPKSEKAKPKRIAITKN